MPSSVADVCAASLPGAGGDAIVFDGGHFRSRRGGLPSARDLTVAGLSLFATNRRQSDIPAIPDRSRCERWLDFARLASVTLIARSGFLHCSPEISGSPALDVMAFDW